MESIRRRSDLLIVKSSESLGRECYGFQATVLLIVRMLAANEPYIHAPHYGPPGLRKLLTFLNSLGAPPFLEKTCPITGSESAVGGCAPASRRAKRERARRRHEAPCGSFPRPRRRAWSRRAETGTWPCPGRNRASTCRAACQQPVDRLTSEPRSRRCAHTPSYLPTTLSGPLHDLPPTAPGGRSAWVSSAPAAGSNGNGPRAH